MQQLFTRPKHWDDVVPPLPFSPQNLWAALPSDVTRDAKGGFLGGSLADGFGNPKSDVDVYVLVDRAPRVTDAYGVDVMHLCGRPIQFEFVELPFIDRAISELAKQHPEDVNLNIADMQVLHRLCNSLPIFEGELIAQLATSVRGAGFASFCSFVREFEAQNSLCDLFGAIEAEHVDIAVYNGRESLRRAMEAVLCQLGETAISDKWIFAKCRRSLGAEHPLTTAYRQLYSAAPLEGESAHLYIAELKTLARVCVEALSLRRALEQVNRIDEWLELLAHLTLARLHGKRNLSCYLRRVRGKHILFFDAKPKFELSTKAALLWMLDDLRRSQMYVEGVEKWEGSLSPLNAADFEVRDQEMLKKWTALGYITA